MGDKFTRYKSCDALGHNQRVQEFIDGSYRAENGEKKKLPTGTSKISVKFIRDINDLEELWKAAIQFEVALVSILIAATEFKFYGAFRNSNRIIAAQKGSLNYNKTLKRALKNYKIMDNSTAILIKDSINRQYERIERNQKSVYENIIDCGISHIIEAMFGTLDIKEVREKLMELDNNLLKEVEDKTKACKTIDEAKTLRNERYNKLIRDIMENKLKHINFDEISSESFDKRKQIVAKQAEKLKEEKVLAKQLNLIKYINADNAALNEKVMACDEEEFKRKSADIFYKASINNGNVYYIAYASNKIVKYVCSGYVLSQNIGKAVLFFNKEEAKLAIDDFCETKMLNKNPSAFKCSVQCIVIPKSSIKCEKSIETLQEIVNRALSFELAIPAYGCRRLVRRLFEVNSFNDFKKNSYLNGAIYVKRVSEQRFNSFSRGGKESAGLLNAVIFSVHDSSAAKKLTSEYSKIIIKVKPTPEELEQFYYMRSKS